MNLALKDEALRLGSAAHNRINAGHDKPHYFGSGCDVAGADER